MKSIIQFHISKGENQYIATGVGLSIVTQAKTLDELAKNIKEAVSLHLEGEELSNHDLAEHPSVLVDFELPINQYA